MNNKKNLSEELKNQLLENKELLFEMANIQPRTTGLKNQLYATFDGKHLVQHGPRVKVRTPNFSKGFPIIIDRKSNKVYPLNEKGEYTNLQKEDKIPVDEAIPYIKEHKEEFLAHWNALIGDEQLRKVLKGEMSLQNALKDAEENGVE